MDVGLVDGAHLLHGQLVVKADAGWPVAVDALPPERKVNEVILTIYGDLASLTAYSLQTRHSPRPKQHVEERENLPVDLVNHRLRRGLPHKLEVLLPAEGLVRVYVDAELEGLAGVAVAAAAAGDAVGQVGELDSVGDLATARVRNEDAVVRADRGGA